MKPPPNLSGVRTVIISSCNATSSHWWWQIERRKSFAPRQTKLNMLNALTNVQQVKGRRKKLVWYDKKQCTNFRHSYSPKRWRCMDKEKDTEEKNSVMRSNENHGTKMTVSVQEKKRFDRTKQNSMKFSAHMPNSPKNATTIDLKSFVTSHDWNVCSSRFHCVTIMSCAWTKTSMPKIWTLFCFVPFFLKRFCFVLLCFVFLSEVKLC